MNRITTRTLFAVAISLFLVGNLIAAVVDSFAWLVVARVVQAGGAAIVMPLLMTTTMQLVSPARRGAAMGLVSVVITVGPALGPTLGGVATATLGWRSAFVIMAIIAAIVLAIGLAVLLPVGELRHDRLDVLSVALSVVGFGGLVYALSSIGEDEVPVWAIAAIAGVGLLALAGFVWRQLALRRTGGAPLLDLRPLTVRNFRLSVGVFSIAFAVLLGTAMLLPLIAQQGMAEGVLVAGLIMLPGAGLQGALGPVIGRLYDAVGPRPLVIPGAILFSAG